MNSDDRAPNSHHSAPPETPPDGTNPLALAEEIAERVVDRLLSDLRDAKWPDKPHLKDISDVARHLQVSPRTVETLVAEGQLAPIWIRGQRRFTEEALDAYLRNRAREGSGGACQ